MSARNLLSLRSHVRPLFLTGGVILPVLIAACSPAASSPIPAVTSSPPATITPETPTETAAPQAKATGASAGDVQSAFDLPAPSAAQVALAALADRLGVQQSAVSVVSVGEATEEPIACELELAGERLQLLLRSAHREVRLEYKGKPYVYWVFTNSPDLLIPIKCK
jgi:hypothetical protein